MRLLPFSALLLLVACGTSEDALTAPPPPNVVLIVADDLGWADLGCYGNPFFESSHLDALAARGVRYERAYAACHVCSPTRASILTGRYPARIGLTNYLYGTKTVPDSPVDPAPFVDRLPLEERTIAEELKTDGYKTALMGKWHLGENTSFGESDPGFQGFDVTEGFDYELLPVGETYEWFRIGDRSRSYELPHLTEEITANSVDFIREHRDTSFFLMVTHYAVHLPLQGEAKLVEKYRAKANPRPDDYHPVYAAMIEQMDHSVGRIVEALEANGVLENTIVLFVSDNGGLAVGEAGDKPTVNDPLRAGKGTMYEGGLRVPMIAYWPERLEGGITDSTLVHTNDLYPTILGWVRPKYEPEERLDGRDLSLVLTDPAPAAAPPKPRSLYWHYPHFSNQGGRPCAVLRRGAYKLIKSLEDDKRELYDLQKDPAETTDLAEKEPALRAEMEAELLRWQREVGAKSPVAKR